MAKANLTLPNGTTVAIEGTADEVAAMLAKVSAQAEGVTSPRKRSATRTARGAARTTKPGRKGPQTLLQELAAENWFRSKRTIGEVQKKLEEGGQIYAMSSLSTPLLRLTRSKVLRRLKDKNGWAYVS